MSIPFEYGCLADDTEVQQLGHLLAQCFISPSARSQAYFDRIGVENFRVIRCGRQIVGGLATIPMGQWFGERCVPMTGIAAVAIAPEYRDSGGAIALMQHTLQELRAQGMAISALYPAAQHLYRRVGYEQGGLYCGWEILPDSIQMRELTLPLQPVSPEVKAFQSLYQQQAQRNTGNLERPQALWQDILPSDQQSIYAYQFGAAEAPEGYIIFTQERTPEGTVLQIKDWAVLTAAAVRSFWSFLTAHRSQIDKVRWRGAVVDALTLLLPQQRIKSRFIDRWLLRVIDVSRALEARGYPPGLQTELHIEIQDDLLVENSGKYVLSVADGRGTVVRGGTGELRLDIRSLAPLYSGLLTPHQLRLAGHLVAPETALSTATQLFAGETPWMPDFF